MLLVLRKKQLFNTFICNIFPFMVCGSFYFKCAESKVIVSARLFYWEKCCVMDFLSTHPTHSEPN